MSYQPVSGIVPQYSDDSNQLASGFYLKFYVANTTTPLSMATDSAGGTLLVKAKLNPEGLPISNPLDNDTVFIPHVDQSYRLVVYRTEDDANADNTAAAFLNVPSLDPLQSINVTTATDTQTVAAALDNRIGKFDSVSAAVTAVGNGQVKVGVKVETLGYYGGWAATASGIPIGGNIYELVDAGSAGARPAEDSGLYFHCTGGSGGLYLKGLFPDEEFTITRWGARLNTDSTTEILAALATGKSICVPEGEFIFSSGLAYTANWQRLYGKGWKSILKQNSNATISTNGFNGVELSNMLIKGPGTGLFKPNNGSNVVNVTGVYFSDGNQRIWVHAATNLTVDGCVFDGTGYQVIQQDGFTSNNCKVVNCTSVNCTGDFVLLNCEVNNQSKNWTVSNNTVTNVGGTFDAATSTEDRFVGATYVDGLVISNNTVDGVAGDSAVHLESPGKTRIIGNVMRNCRAPAGAARFVYILPIVETSSWYSAAADVIIQGNDFVIDTDVASGTDDFIANASVSDSGRIIIRDNNFFYYGSGYPADPATKKCTGIRFGSYSGVSIIAGNQFRNLVSGAVVSSNEQGTPAIKYRPSFKSNLFEKCTTAITGSATGWIGSIEDNTFKSCTQSFDIANSPSSVRENHFISSGVTGFVDFDLQMVSGNRYQDCTPDDYQGDQEVQIAHNVATTLGVLGFHVDSAVTLNIYGRLNASTTFTNETFFVSNRAGVLQATSLAKHTNGANAPSFVLSISGNDLLQVTQTNGGSSAIGARISVVGL